MTASERGDGSPRVVALIPAYNPKRYDLLLSIASMLGQSVAVDICIVDDGSNELVSSLIEPDERITVIRLDRNGGISEALNEGARYAVEHGYDYICRLDVGDVSLPTRVAQQLAYMERNPGVALLGSAAAVFDPDGKPTHIHGAISDAKELDKYIRLNSPFKHSTFFIRAGSITNPLYSTKYGAAEDYELLLRLHGHGGIACLPRPLVEYHEDLSGISATKRRTQLEARFRLQLRHFSPSSFHSYLGVLRTAVIMLLPADLARNLSALHWRSRLRR
jgi:glycosyltransferase involved in cell wall biosynthesis